MNKEYKYQPDISLLTSTKTPVLGKMMTSAAKQLVRTGTSGSSKEDLDLF